MCNRMVWGWQHCHKDIGPMIIIVVDIGIRTNGAPSQYTRRCQKPAQRRVANTVGRRDGPRVSHREPHCSVRKELRGRISSSSQAAVRERRGFPETQTVARGTRAVTDRAARPARTTVMSELGFRAMITASAASHTSPKVLHRPLEVLYSLLFESGCSANTDPNPCRGIPFIIV
jgi:hypothetical protein